MTELEDRVRHLENEIASASRGTEPCRLAALLGQLGSNLVAVGLRDRGMEALSKSLALYEEHGDLPGVAECLNRIGAFLSDDRPDEARVVFDRALRTARAAGDRSAEATSLHNFGILEEMDGNLDRSIEQYRQSMELLRSLDEQDKLATTLNAFGLALDLNGEAEAAQEAWREALSMQKAVGNDAGVASTLNNIGSAMERRGDVEGAIKHYGDALAIQEGIGEFSEQIIMLGNLRLAYFKVGRRAESIQALHRVLGIQEKVDDKFGAAATLHKLAETFASEGITPEADEHYARAMAAFEALGEPAEVAFVEMDRALAWSRADEHEKAIGMGEHALRLRLETNDLHTAAAMDNLGLLYSAAGDRTKAIELMERSLRLTEKLDDKEGMLIVLCNLADEYDLADREVNAIECYRRALPLAEAANDRSALAKVLDELGRIHWSLDDDVPAEAFTKRALTIYEQQPRDADVDRLRARLEQLDRKLSGN